MRKGILLFVIIVCFTPGCSLLKIFNPEPKNYGEVKVVKVTHKVDKDDNISLDIIESKEKAEKSIEDKDSSSLLSPQRYNGFSSYFDYFDLGPNNDIVVSVYNSNSKKNSDIWIIKNNGAKVRLTNTSYNHFTPAFSSNGKYIYFSSYRGKTKSNTTAQDSYLWRYPSSGIGGITRIGSGAYKLELPKESPDGTKISYSAVELYGNNDYIWFMNDNGSLPTQLKQGRHPSWLNDGHLIFQGKDENSQRINIWTCGLDGSDFTQLISDNNKNCIQPCPSPDGKYIAFVKEDPEASNLEESRDIYVYSKNTGLIQQITTNKSRDDLPKWSKDGSYLFFRSSRGVGWNIWRISTNFLKNN